MLFKPPSIQVLACVLLPALLIGCQRPAATGDRDELAAAWERRVAEPNIVLIVIDTLRRDHLGCYGYPRDTSPNIDRFAEQSVVYDNAFSQAPWTLPSVASLLTSRYPSELGIRSFTKRIPDEEVFLQEILAAHGYETHAIVSHDFVGSKWGFDQGFQSFESFAAGHRASSARSVTDAALRRLDHFGDRPTFLFLHYFDPHFFYFEHEDHRFSTTPPDPESEWWQGPWRRLRKLATRGRLSEAQRDYLMARYDSEIAHTDEHLGRVLDRLKETGRFADTIVILTADHGEEFLDHGGLSHTVTVFNELVNVPLIIRWPGTAEPVRSTRYVALVDLLPTLLDYTGISAQHKVSGVPLRDRQKALPVFSETRRYRRLTAVIRDGVKLVFDEDRQQMEFYDLVADPGEQTPLADWDGGDDLVAQVEAFRQRSEEGLARLDQEPDLEMSEEELKKLRALGYVD